MTDTPARIARPRPLQLLGRLLDDPTLVTTVQGLAPRTLGALVNAIGLADAGEIVALATTEQLQRVFDEDLWRSARPGQDETFDPERFALWLEIMLEAGEELTARKLVELPEDLVTLALHRHVLVINIDELAVEMSGYEQDDDVLTMTEKALDSCLYHEIAEHRIISRRPDGWDAIVAVLTALDRDHHDYLQRLLERCCYVSSEWIEDNGGLYSVLTSEEMLETDAAADREDRRAREGFIAPSAAASFLSLARVTPLEELEKARVSDPVTRAYFRSYQPAVAAAPAGARRPAPPAPPAMTAAVLGELLKDELPDEARATLLLGGRAGAADPAALFRGALEELRAADADLAAPRMQELSYLANVLVAGCSFGGRRFRAVEAVEAVVCACNLGLEHLLRPAGPRRAAEDARAVLARDGADKLFRVGWHLLFRDVVLPAGRALAQLLARRATSADLGRVAAAVRAAVDAGTPWTARGRLPAVAGVLDAPTLAAVTGLLGECPALAGPLRGDPRVPGLIATRAQVQRVQAFVGTL
ncbi:MAG TPA: DUF6178 family protein [Polyangia bacterium]|jgi:hypothetical protein